MPELLDVDRRVYRLVHERWRWRTLDPVMVLITRTGTKGMLWIAIVIAMVALRIPDAIRASVLSMTALLLAEGLTNILLKPSVRRERPYLRQQHRLLVDAPGPHSWPSAHASSSMAAGAVLAVLFPRVAPLFLGLAILVGYSRVYVGVHYPVDVLAGFILGLLVVAAVMTAAHITHFLGL